VRRDTTPHGDPATIRHPRSMARSQAQSDFSVSRPPEVKLPAVAALVELPRAEESMAEAGAFATRWVMRLTVLVLAALAVLCLVGPHIPGGE
jgi:hypothetical protein